ncbi:MAG: sensor histidine kinase [Gammaproteobacteria bacterium]
MTIRRALLLALLAFSVAFAALMTALSYSRARAALSDEIRLNLETQALTLMTQIDAMLFERIKNVEGWRRLDVMQEIRVGDVDKRLARFLDDIETAYAGVYTDLQCVQGGRVVASSDPGAIGAPASMPPAWLEVAVGDGTVRLARPRLDRLPPTLALSSDVRDAYSGDIMGQLVARLDWSEIQRLLDESTNESDREALLLDAGGRVLAGSSGLRPRVASHALDVVDWHLDDQAHGVITLDGESVSRRELLLGYAHDTAYKGLPKLGWSLLVLTPTDAAFAPVQRLLWQLLALLAATVAVAALLAVRISARGARPLQELTRYARAIGADIDTPMRDIAGTDEVRELGAAFNSTVAELRRSRAHLVRVSKLAAVGEMAAVLAHEVRTPLGIIRSSAQLLGRQDRLDETGREMAGFMINECDRINGLVTSLLEAARPRSPEMHEHDVNAIVRHVLDLLAPRTAERGVEVAFTPAPGLPALRCDREQIVQVLLNVLTNAIAVLDGGGHVRVVTAFAEPMLCIRIEDDGPGIPPERRELVFEPFVSFRRGGIGLGLPIVREIVELHGGSVAIDEAELGGASFVILLPAITPHAPGRDTDDARDKRQYLA